MQIVYVYVWHHPAGIYWSNEHEEYKRFAEFNIVNILLDDGHWYSNPNVNNPKYWFEMLGDIVEIGKSEDCIFFPYYIRPLSNDECRYSLLIMNGLMPR